MSAPVYVPLATIARVCVLTTHTLQSRYWPAHWGAPHDFTFVRTAVLVNQAVLPDLVRELAGNGQEGTAAVLQRWLDEKAAEEQRAAPARETAPAVGWLNRWEVNHEA